MKRIRESWVLPIACLLLAGCGSSGPSGFFEGGDAHGRGQVVRPDSSTETFTIQPLTNYSGFTPPGDYVDVHTGAGTRFLNRSGGQMTAQEWYDYVTLNFGPSTAAQAKGDYTAGRIEAEEVRLE